MKRCVFGLVLLAMFLPTASFCQGLDDLDYEIKMHERKMELEQRKADMELKRRMGELELKKHELGLEKLRNAVHKDKPHPLLLLVLVVHILTALWVYQDIRQRDHGSGIWIVIALLTGLLGTLVYAVVRLGNSDKKKT